MKLTYEDYVRIPDDGLRHEIIDGVHHVSPAPIPKHQLVLGQLHVSFHNLQTAGAAMVLLAPTDVQFSQHDIVQPDLVVVGLTQSEILTETRVIGSPQFVAEVLSPSTARLDRGLKLQLYASAGVNEYWIVDCVNRELTQHVSRDGGYESHCYRDVRVRSDAFPDVEIDLVELFGVGFPDWMS